MAIDVQSFPLIKEPRERVELVWSAGDAGVDGNMKQSTSSAMTVPLCYRYRPQAVTEGCSRNSSARSKKYVE